MKTLACPLAVATLLAAMTSAASAQTTRTWTNPTAPGDWGTAANWGGTTPTAAEIARIGGQSTAPTTPDLNAGTFNVLGLFLAPRQNFTASDFIIQSTGGTGTLNLGSSGITMDNGGRVTIASSVTLNLTVDQNWGGFSNSPNVGTGLTVNGLITGAFKITLNDANADNYGTFVFANAGSTFSGGFTQVKRTVSVTATSVVSSGLLASGPLGTGTIELQGGTFNLNSNTLHNNILLTGNTFYNNAATFSDAGLTVASKFTLGSNTNGNVTRIRTNNAAITLNQEIAESGGTGQSIQFSSTSGTPTITINRTKTATGNILAGSVNLVLGNGAANPGALIGVNGSITATGSNKFSSGALISDNTALIATDATNFSAIAGGKATVFNNARVSFATDQTQAAVAGLLSADSQVRLGLSSGALSPTVTQNYDQSAIGNGKAGLVSASTGTVTYTGSLTAGSDSTYRVGGGLGTLALTGTTLTGSSKNVSIEGGGTVNASANQDFTGSTNVNSALILSGASGALSATSGITANNTSLTLDNTTANANRLANSAGITLNRGTLAMNGSTTAIAESIGTLTINSGFNTISMGTAAGAANTKSITTGTLARTAGSVALFRGDNFGLSSGGGSALTRNLVIVSTVPAGANFVGGGGANGTTNISIIPWARTGSGTTATGGNFLTFDSSNNSLRPLVTGTEFATNVDTAVNNTDNVRQTVAATGTTTLLTADRTRNSFILSNSGATAATVGSLGGFTLNVTSGAVDLSHTVAQNYTLNNGTLAFGAAEGVITSSGGSSSLTSVGTAITGSNGVAIFANNGGTLGLAGNNTFIGGITVGSNGGASVAVDQDQRFGNAANSVTHAGGTLQFFAGFASARGLTLLGNVGNNTLANNTTSSTVTWNGNITGAGLLRLINNASTAGTGGFSLGGSNDYSGGTQIEGINVTGSTNNALGTGTVTLIGATGNAPALTLTGTAPTLGGLRGTDGTVTINSTASTATLTIGSNNENTVFNGVITQGAGKTGAVTKTGTGILIFTNNHIYTGDTTISGGTLLANNGTGSGSATGGGNVILGTGARLGGSGTVGSTILGTNVTVQSGGTLFAGQSGVLDAQELIVQSGGTITLGGKVELDIIGGAGSGVLNAQSGNNDRIIFTPLGGSAGTSTPVITGSLQINSSLTGWTAGTAFDLFDWANLTTSFSNLPNSGFMQGNPINLPDLTSLSLLWDWSNLYTSGQLGIIAVPEPSRALLLLLGSATLLLRRRRHA